MPPARPRSHPADDWRYGYMNFYHRRFQGWACDNYQALLSSTIPGLCVTFINIIFSIRYRLPTHTPAKVSTIREETIGRSLCSFHPLDGTALVRQFKFPATWRLETSRLGPVMQTKSEGRRGSQMCRLQCVHHWDKEFPEPLTGASLRSRRELCIRQCK